MFIVVCKAYLINQLVKKTFKSSFRYKVGKHCQIKCKQFHKSVYLLRKCHFYFDKGKHVFRGIHCNWVPGFDSLIEF